MPGEAVQEEDGGAAATGWRRFDLRCPCGSERLRVLGHPSSAAGPGGPVRQALRRMFVETRVRDAEREGVDPFVGAIGWACDVCGQGGELFDPARDGWAAREGRVEQAPATGAREAYRCRPCRRTVVRLRAGFSYRQAGWDPPELQSDPDRFDAFELHAECLTCGREARLANRPCGRFPA